MDTEFIELSDKEINAEEDGKINYIFEGDNLEWLNIFKTKYLNEKIDIIYIDPPYNTKKNIFIYNDTYKKNEWNEFIKNRLKIAKEILNDKYGAIFISIDDNEYVNLKEICDDIFSKKNYVATVIRNTKSERNQAKIIKIKHEYLLVYSYNKYKMLTGLTRNIESMNEYVKVDSDDDCWKTSDLTTRRPNYYQYSIPYLNDLKRFNKRKWKYPESRLKELMGYDDEIGYEEIYKSKKEIIIGRKKWYTIGEIVFRKETGVPYEKLYYKETQIPNTIWDDISSQGEASEYLKKIIGKDININPKPVDFIKKILKWYNKKDAIILDFFAGSGTTGEAAMELNSEDNGDRAVILINNNENNICSDILYTRIKKVINLKNYKSKFKYLKIEVDDNLEK